MKRESLNDNLQAPDMVNTYIQPFKQTPSVNNIEQQGKEAFPSLMYIVSQSVKLFEHRETDAHKKVNGRKRQLLVDTGGRIWVC